MSWTSPFSFLSKTSKQFWSITVNRTTALPPFSHHISCNQPDEILLQHVVLILLMDLFLSFFNIALFSFRGFAQM